MEIIGGDWHAGQAQGPRVRLTPSIVPTMAACMLLAASLLPWLDDPLGRHNNAWQLPINIGWQLPVALPAVLSFICSYGMLCLCCAACCLLLGWPNNKPKLLTGSYFTAGLFCLLPVAFFLLQYLCIDMQAINSLAQHQVQWLLVSRHIGYSLPSLRIPAAPFTVDASTIQGRFILLVQQVSYGLLLPCLSAGGLFACKRHAQPRPVGKQSRRYGRLIVGAALLLIVLGRAPTAMLCEHEARNLLAEGNYASALGWLDAALFLNPSLNQLSSYHIERGQSLYYLHGDERSADSRSYLAYTYRQQNDDLGAYQELLAIWQSPTADTKGTRPSWVMDEMSLTLAKLAEFTHPLSGPPLLRPIDDDSALPWLELLSQVDPTNVYGRYAAGRIQYDLHNYTMSIAQMNAVIRLSDNANLQSSAYTYLALSAGGQGKYSDERDLLFKAVALDPDYHNNTAREALSGLH